MELATRLETITPARFMVEACISNTLQKVVLKDPATGYRQATHVLATKGRVGVDKAKEDLAIDFMLGLGSIYADKVKEHKNKPHKRRGSRVHSDGW